MTRHRSTGPSRASFAGAEAPAAVPPAASAPAKRAVLVAAALTLLGSVAAPGQTLSDFGYMNMRHDNVPAIGTRPLLLILATIADEPALNHSPEYYRELVYGTAPNLTSLNNYIIENSCNTFRWTTVTELPIQVSLATNESLPALESYMLANGLDQTHGIHWFEYAWFSNVVYKSVTQAGFDYTPFDTSGDDRITSSELGVLVLANDPGSVGLARAPVLSLPGQNLTFAGICAAVMEQYGQDFGFNIFCHEATHLFGMYDLYGGAECRLSPNLSLYADKFKFDPGDSYPNITGDPDEIYHLDPWHKLQLGWIQPQIHSLAAAGSATLHPPQSGRQDAAAILHDPACGTREFLMVEYRAYDTAYGSGFDTNVAGNGMVLWHVVHNDILNPAWITCRCGGCVYGSRTNYGVFTEGPLWLKFGGWVPWGSDQDISSPRLYGATAGEPLFHATFSVNTFAAGASSLTLSWTHVEWTWVDFTYSGIEAGTFSQPYNSLAEAVQATSPGGRIRIKSGAGSETISGVTKALTIESFDGSVSIGQ